MRRYQDGDGRLFPYFQQTPHLLALLFGPIRHRKESRLFPAHFWCESSEFFLFFPSPLILHMDLRGSKVHLFQLANDLF